jgi:hypothetical protein
MAKKSSRRGQKKEILRRFESSFDLDRLNLSHQVKLIKPKAMIIGLVTAMVLYGLGFAVAYVGMSSNTVPLELFAKLVWILMIPTTIVGFFAWQLSRNRMEYPIRMDIRRYMTELESDGGLLWRFAPIVDDELMRSPEVKKAFSWSADGKIDKLDVDDYVLAIETLDDQLREAPGKYFTQQMLDKLEINFREHADAA